MSDNKPLRIDPPGYVTMDEKEREEFLSDIGTFSPAEREVFHRLCNAWEPEIPYSRISGGTSSEQNNLDRLIEKLRVHGYGLIRTSVEGRKSQKTAVVLTSRWDIRYCVTLLDEEILRLLDSGSPVFATEHQLRTNGVALPDEFVRPADFDTLARAYSEDFGTTPPILRLEGLNGVKHLTSSRFARRFVSAAIERVKSQCVNAPLLELLARLRDKSLTETRNIVGSKDAGSWLELTTLLLDNRDTIEAKRNVVVDEGLFQAAFLVHGFLVSEIAETKKRKRATEEKKADFAAIVQAVLEQESPLLSTDELASVVQRVRPKYGAAFESFSREFYDAVLSPIGKRNMPLLLRVVDRYIHRDRVYAQFRARLADATIDLGEEYVSRMNYQLRHPLSTTDQAFLSRDNFENDIEDRVRTQYPYLWHLIQKPGLFAEALIQGLKHEKGSATVDEIRPNLAKYLNVKEGEFLPLSHLLDLNMVSIYEIAFQRLPVLRHLFYRISGRYDAYKSKYAGRTMQSVTRDRHRFRDTDPPLPEPGVLGASRRRYEASNAPTGMPAPGSTRPKQRPHRKSVAEEGKPASRRVYNEIERNEAWIEFSKSLRK